MSIATVQALVEHLITQANPFRGAPAGHWASARARVRAVSPPRDVAYLLAKANGPVTLRKKGRGSDAEQARSDAFVQTAQREAPVSDKVTAHSYQTMYGALLTPAARSAVHKFLEIGLGCRMSYGAGASVRIWAEWLPRAERWEAEFDEACVRSTRDKLAGINVLTGDQGNETTLAHWIVETGGSFDMIVDDGGHYNHQVMRSFAKLWPHLNPGGIYVMEDIHVCRTARYDWATNGSNVPADFLLAVAARLLGGAAEPVPARFCFGQRCPDTVRPPADVDWLLCQEQACALGKRRAPMQRPAIAAMSSRATASGATPSRAPSAGGEGGAQTGGHAAGQKATSALARLWTAFG